MRRIISQLLVTIGSALVNAGKRIETPPLAREITLSHRRYRIINPGPSRGEVFRLGMGILFSSAAFGLGVTYG